MRRKGILITLLFLWIYLVGILCLFFCSTKTQKSLLRFGRCVSFGLAP